VTVAAQAANGVENPCGWITSRSRRRRCASPTVVTLTAFSSSTFSGGSVLTTPFT
jgi:hypothetical protein